MPSLPVSPAQPGSRPHARETAVFWWRRQCKESLVPAMPACLADVDGLVEDFGCDDGECLGWRQAAHCSAINTSEHFACQCLPVPASACQPFEDQETLTGRAQSYILLPASSHHLTPRRRLPSPAAPPPPPPPPSLPPSPAQLQPKQRHPISVSAPVIAPPTRSYHTSTLSPARLDK